MKILYSPQAAKDLEGTCVVFWIEIAIFEFGLKKQAPRILLAVFWLPGKIVRLFALVIGIGFLLSGCSNPDPLAVATGPLYQLNTGYWQPAPHDLSAPPTEMHN